MKHSIFILTLITLIACQQPSKEHVLTESAPKIEYPEAVSKVFEAHGGIDTWNKMHGLSYEIVKEDQNEKQLIDLKDRRERIDGEDFIMGYDGENYWVEADTTYKGNPVFYKNLIFYFYAMPFVVADPGIKYTTVDPLVIGDTSYPGFRVSYDDGVGISSEDEYYIHYNPETYQMTWLAYTVTYFSKEKSKKLSWIHYDDWQNIDGVILPKSMGWYNSEENLPTEEKRRRSFTNVKLMKSALAENAFTKTAGAKVVEE
jgi:hypothetical protein